MKLLRLVFSIRVSLISSRIFLFKELTFSITAVLRSSVVTLTAFKSALGVKIFNLLSSPGKFNGLFKLSTEFCSLVWTEVWRDWYDLARMIFLTRFLILLMLSLRLSYRLMHTRFIVSMNRFDLILRSSGDSVASDGLRLTSISHGLISESRRMSKPSSSKQFFLCGIFLRPAEMWESTEMSDFRITS